MRRLVRVYAKEGVAMGRWLSMLSVGASLEAQDSASAAFEKLRALAGNWQGTLEWTGARTGSGSVKAEYYLTGNGSAIVENLTMGGGSAPSMSSVYHLDGADLRMTHYCGANQPRLRAQRIDIRSGVLDFAFVDATNLPSPDAAHVGGVEIRLLDSDHISVRFLFVSGTQHSRETLDLKRTGTKAQ
jgi:hypothetical protein